jgi:hypothetical protein
MTIAAAWLSRNVRSVRLVPRGKGMTFIGDWVFRLPHVCVQSQEYIFPT